MLHANEIRVALIEYISIILEFYYDSFVSNYEQSNHATSLEVEEEFDSSSTTEFAGIKYDDIMVILEDISYFGAASNASIDPIILEDSYMIACTNFQSFTEDGEAHESTITMEQLGHMFYYFRDYLLIQYNSYSFGYDLITICAILIKLDHLQDLGVDLQNTLFSQMYSHLNSEVY